MVKGWSSWCWWWCWCWCCGCRCPACVSNRPCRCSPRRRCRPCSHSHGRSSRSRCFGCWHPRPIHPSPVRVRLRSPVPCPVPVLALDPLPRRVIPVLVVSPPTVPIGPVTPRVPIWILLAFPIPLPPTALPVLASVAPGGQQAPKQIGSGPCWHN